MSELSQTPVKDPTIDGIPPKSPRFLKVCNNADNFFWRPVHDMDPKKLASANGWS